MIEHHFPVDDGVMDTIGQYTHPPAVVRKVMHNILSSRLHRVRIEHD